MHDTKCKNHGMKVYSMPKVWKEWKCCPTTRNMERKWKCQAMVPKTKHFSIFPNIEISKPTLFIDEVCHLNGSFMPIHQYKCDGKVPHQYATFWFKNAPPPTPLITTTPSYMYPPNPNSTPKDSTSVNKHKNYFSQFFPCIFLFFIIFLRFFH